MRIQTLLLLVAFLAFPLPAQAITWSDCHGNTGGDLITVTAYQLLCADFDENDVTGTDSRIFRVGTNTALLCFDPALDSEGADTAEINFRYCPNGIQPGSTPENHCFALSNVPITGITGAAGTQDACERVGPGTYMFEITTQGAANDDSRVTIQGEAD
jgi:hypothetical protein